MVIYLYSLITERYFSDFDLKYSGETFPAIPGGDPRSYPSTGSAVLLPLQNLEAVNSTAILLRDGRGGSNPHAFYNFTGVLFPTELSLEAFSPEGFFVHFRYGCWELDIFIYMKRL
ncbi:unnamed protein product [Arabis nemorensis]|uniref:Glyoxal oxidase N-terminal domain-containing protein n=1 Tax=Arabis nemorensis TaxID=586526 RepID=A0A565ARF0_9BRAS|nr:unnamed protein product [Arabis nemorensis]